MLFNVATAAVALFAASASAIAVPQGNAGNSDGSNMCDASTFNNGVDYHITQAKSQDCLDLINNIDRRQTWSVAKSWARLETQGTCAFSVRVMAGSKNGLIGGADMFDLVTDSVKNFQQKGKVSCRGAFAQIVSAEGEVNCNTTPTGAEKVRVEWIIASSGYNPSN